LPYNATAAQIQSAIDGLALIGPGQATVTAVANQPGSFTIAPAAGISSLPLSVAQGATATFSGSQLTVTGTGAYVLTDGTNFVALAATATKDQIQTALGRFSNNAVEGVAVTGASGNFTISAVPLTGVTVQSLALTHVNLFAGVNGAFSNTVDSNGN